MSEHTPGPLTASGRHIYKDVEAGGLLADRICIGVAKLYIKRVDVGVMGSDAAQAWANARLWAAAPDLLAACEAVLPWVITATAYRAEIHPQAVANHKADLEQLMAAIARAKGGTS